MDRSKCESPKAARILPRILLCTFSVSLKSFIYCLVFILFCAKTETKRNHKFVIRFGLHRGGDWDSGGSCNGEKEPVKKGAILDSYPLKMKIVEEAIKEMQVPVILLNVTKLTNFRKDGHPSIYGKPNMDGKKVSTRKQDCSHWCLPGVPDVWNHLIYVSLLLQAHS